MLIDREMQILHQGIVDHHGKTKTEMIKNTFEKMKNLNVLEKICEKDRWLRYQLRCCNACDDACVKVENEKQTNLSQKLSVSSDDRLLPVVKL